jgi:hypothetical protein
VAAQWAARDRHLPRFVCEQPPYSMLSAGSRPRCCRPAPAADVALDEVLLDRIDKLVPPGTNLNPADGGWANPALQPAARRR